MEVLKGKLVTWIGDSKYGDGKVFYLKGVEGVIATGDVDVGALKKGDTVDVKVKEDDKGFILKVLRVTEKAKSGGTGGGKPRGGKPWGGKGGGGGGYKKDPETQASIIMQHSQPEARERLAFLIAQGGIKLPAAAKIKDFLLAELDVLTVALAQQAEGATALKLIQQKADEPDTASDDDDDDDFGEESETKDEFDDDFDDE